MGLKMISEIGKDSVMAPFISDFRKFSDRLVQLFHDQPQPGRILAPRIDDLAFDGTTEHETARLKDIKRPEYAMAPDNANRNVLGDSVIVKTPQIFQSASLLNDVWKLTLGGNARMPLLVSRMLQLVKVEEDLIVWQGRNGVKGLVSSLTEDLGPPGGNWKTDADGDGILEIAHADIEKSFDKFDSYAIGHLPVDVIFTPAIYRKFVNTIVPYAPETNNIDILRAKLNGGEIYVTGNLQTGFAKASNTFVAIARTGESDAAWEILSSGIEQKLKEDGLWKTEMGMREKFAPKILDGRFIQWMDGITVA